MSPNITVSLCVSALMQDEDQDYSSGNEPTLDRTLKLVHLSGMD
jgi:hypothetical protein